MRWQGFAQKTLPGFAPWRPEQSAQVAPPLLIRRNRSARRTVDTRRRHFRPLHQSPRTSPRGFSQPQAADPLLEALRTAAGAPPPPPCGWPDEHPRKSASRKTEALGHAFSTSAPPTGTPTAPTGSSRKNSGRAVSRSSETPVLWLTGPIDLATLLHVNVLEAPSTGGDQPSPVG